MRYYLAQPRGTLGVVFRKPSINFFKKNVKSSARNEFFLLLNGMKRILLQIERNTLAYEFGFSNLTALNFTPSSIYLPPREAEFLDSMLNSGWKLRNFLIYSLEKYQKVLVRNMNPHRSIRKKIQSRVEQKKRYSFRPDPSSWVEIQLLAQGLGTSCCVVVLELIQLAMNELLGKFIEHLENVGISTSNLNHPKKFQIHYHPMKKKIQKIYKYCNGFRYASQKSRDS